jgi:hypothetical protein
MLQALIYIYKQLFPGVKVASRAKAPSASASTKKKGGAGVDANKTTKR